MSSYFVPPPFSPQLAYGRTCYTERRKMKKEISEGGREFETNKTTATKALASSNEHCKEISIYVFPEK
jgi:hypothetical protein